MPAIDLKRFEKETADLVEQFNQPAVFIVTLRSILDRYSNRTIHKQKSRIQTSGLPNSNVPDQVITQIVIELNKATYPSTEVIFTLLEHLWKEGTFESRLICARLFHKLPAELLETFIRLNNYLGQNADPTIARAFLRSGMRTIRLEKPLTYLEVIQNWLDDNNPRLAIYAVKSLIVHIMDDPNINLPQVINLLIPEIRQNTLAHQFDLVELVTALAEHSETEARYFLKESLRPPIPRTTQITFRKFSEQFPPSFGQLTRDLLRKGAPHS